MTFIRDRPEYLWAGLALLAVAAACVDLATVPYNAMLRQLVDAAELRPDLRLWFGCGFFGSVVCC